MTIYIEIFLLFVVVYLVIGEISYDMFKKVLPNVFELMKDYPASRDDVCKNKKQFFKGTLEDSEKCTFTGIYECRINISSKGIYVEKNAPKPSHFHQPIRFLLPPDKVSSFRLVTCSTRTKSWGWLFIQGEYFQMGIENSSVKIYIPSKFAESLKERLFLLNNPRLDFPLHIEI